MDYADGYVIDGYGSVGLDGYILSILSFACSTTFVRLEGGGEEERNRDRTKDGIICTLVLVWS